MPFAAVCIRHVCLREIRTSLSIPLCTGVCREPRWALAPTAPAASGQPQLWACLEHSGASLLVLVRAQQGLRPESQTCWAFIQFLFAHPVVGRDQGRECSELSTADISWGVTDGPQEPCCGQETLWVLLQLGVEYRTRETGRARAAEHQAEQIRAAFPLPLWKLRILFIFAGANGPPGWDDVAHIC